MSRYINGNNEPVIDDYNACTFNLDDSCTCEYECSVCRFFKREIGTEKPEAQNANGWKTRFVVTEIVRW